MGQFADFPDRGAERVDYDRPKYIRFKEGMPVIVRILDNKAHKVVKHWVNNQKISIMCLGDDCPICQRNDQLRRENPDTDFRKLRGYIPQNYRYLVNVLDRTPVLIDSQTGDEYYAQNGKFPITTSDGERSLAGIEPQASNTIKVLERGIQLFEQLSVIHNETLEVNDSGVEGGGLTSFDIKFTTLGEGQKMVITPITMTQRNDDVASVLKEKELTLYVLSTLGIQLEPDEINKLVSGINLSDIFAARRATEDSEAVGVLAADESDVAKSLQELFPDI